MYTDVGEQDALSQGDIIGDVLFGYTPIAAPALYNQDGVKVNFDLAEPLGLENELDLMIPAEKSLVMILSQACDCLSKPYVCVARVVPLDIFDKNYAAKIAGKKATLKSNTEYIQDLYQRAGAKPDAFYLQEKTDINLPKSVASFLELHSVATTHPNMNYLRENRLTRLSPEALFDLQFRLAFYFGRFATTEDYMLTNNEKDAVAPPTPQASRT